MSHLTHSPCAEALAEGPTVVHFTGARVSLDDETIYRARDTLFAIAAEPNRSPVFLDFRKVRYVSSAALGTLVGLHRALLAAGRRLTIHNLRPEVYEVFAVTHLDRVLDLRRAEPDGDLADDGRPPGPDAGVLVAADEPALRYLLEAALGSAGLRVWSAADGAEAVELYRANPGAIEVVLLDVLMPRLDGPHALAALQKLCPTVRCCFLTGGAGPYSEEALLEAGAARLFRKPFVLAEVIETVSRLAHPAVADRWIELPLVGV